MGGIGISAIEETNYGDFLWDPQVNYFAAVFARSPFNKSLSLQTELCYLTQRSYRSFDHPESYVFYSDVSVASSELKLPISVIYTLNWDFIPIELYAGLGGSISIPLSATKHSKLVYYNQTRKETESISEQYPSLVYGNHFLMGVNQGDIFAEIRFNRDASSFDLEYPLAEDLRFWDCRIIFGLSGIPSLRFKLW